jgi:hypothetical protein
VRVFKLSALIAFIHFAVFSALYLLQDSLVLGRVNDVVLAGSVYLPLLFWSAIGLKVFQSGGAVLSTPTTVGWLLCIVTWFLVYVVISYVIISRLKNGEKS